MRAPLLILLICAGLRCAYAQQAVSPVEGARRVKELANSRNGEVEADAPGADETTSDGTFGEQVILQSPPRVRTFVITGDTSVFYTNNAALTPHHRIDDVVFVSNAGINWTPQIAPRLEMQIGAHGSIFRYDKASELDFQGLGLGVGLFWKPDHFAGVGLFARYDFIEVIDRHNEEILRDHEFTIGAQRAFPLGRAHAVVVGGSLMAGVATPKSAQRDQAGLFLAYRLQATHRLDVEFLYRLAGYFYNDVGRNDFSQLLSVSAHYRLVEWADINAFFSFADNRSDVAAFSYDAVTNGGGLSATIRF